LVVPYSPFIYATHTTCLPTFVNLTPNPPHPTFVTPFGGNKGGMGGLDKKRKLGFQVCLANLQSFAEKKSRGL